MTALVFLVSLAVGIAVDSIVVSSTGKSIGQTIKDKMAKK